MSEVLVTSAWPWSSEKGDPPCQCSVVSMVPFAAQVASWSCLELVLLLHAKGTIWMLLCGSCKFSLTWRRLLELSEAISGSLVPLV